VVLYPDVAPFAHNRFDCCDLLPRNVIYRTRWSQPRPTSFDSRLPKSLSPSREGALARGFATLSYTTRWDLTQAVAAPPKRDESAPF
jgi:hypothetical protein